MVRSSRGRKSSTKGKGKNRFQIAIDGGDGTNGKNRHRCSGDLPLIAVDHIESVGFRATDPRCSTEKSHCLTRTGYSGVALGQRRPLNINALRHHLAQRRHNELITPPPVPTPLVTPSGGENAPGWILAEGVRRIGRDGSPGSLPSLLCLSLRALGSLAGALRENGLREALDAVPSELLPALSACIAYGEGEFGRATARAFSSSPGLCLRDTGDATGGILEDFVVTAAAAPVARPESAFVSWEGYEDGDAAIPALGRSRTGGAPFLRRLEISGVPDFPLQQFCSLLSSRPGNLLTHLSLAGSMDGNTGPTLLQRGALLLHEASGWGDPDGSGNANASGTPCFLPRTLEVLDLSGCGWVTDKLLGEFVLRHTEAYGGVGRCHLRLVVAAGCPGVTMEGCVATTEARGGSPVVSSRGGRGRWPTSLGGCA